MQQFDFTTQGWECPRCKRVYSPTTIMCIVCPSLSGTGMGTSSTPIGVGGYGTTTASTLCRLFVPDPSSGTSPKCINCGKSQLDHSTITNLY